MKRRTWSPLTVVLACVLACAACSGGTQAPTGPIAPLPQAKAGPAVHLVMDVGSTGSRLYLWSVRLGEGGRCEVGDAAPLRDPVESKLDGLGWARWARGKSPAEVRARVEKATGAMLVAARVEELGPSYAVAAGTGGFRDPDTAAPYEGVPELAAVWDGIRDALGDEKRPTRLGPDHVFARAIPGEDEARTAWAGLRELRGLDGSFSVIEVGGATVQFAWGPHGAPYEAIHGASDYKGQDAMYALLAREPGDTTPVPKTGAPLPSPEAFRERCVPARGKRGDGKACADLIHDAIFQPRDGWPFRLAPALAAAPAADVFGLGALKYVFTGDQPARTLADLETEARRTCALDLDQAAAETKFKPERACFRAAYAAAFFRAIAPKARGAELLRSDGKGASKNDADLWVRGIAVQRRFFPDCR